MSDTEATTAAPRRSQRDKRQVERFGSGAYPLSCPRGDISTSRIPLDNTKKRKRAEEPDSDTSEPVSDSDDQDLEGEEEDEEPRKTKPKRKAPSAKPKPKAAKPKPPPQKKPRIPRTTSAKIGSKATKRTRRPKGGDIEEPFTAEKLAKDTHISGDNPLFSTRQFLQTRIVLTFLTQMPS